MQIKLLSLSKNQDFKSLLTGKKISNKYINIFFKNLSNKSNNYLNISFVTQKKIGNAVKRNKIKRRLRNIMNNALNEISIKTEFSYLIISKKNMVDGNFLDIKETLIMDFKKIK